MWIVFGVRGVLLLSLEGPLWALAGGMSRAEMGALEPEFLGLPDLQLESSWPPVQLCGGGGSFWGGLSISLSVCESLPYLGVPVTPAFQVGPASPSPPNWILTQHRLVLGPALGTGLGRSHRCPAGSA